MQSLKHIAFVCSANYYRSRFAELWFNHLAAQRNLPWRADSRGLLVGHWGNIGPISHYTVDALREMGVEPGQQHRDPRPLTLADLGRFDRVIALKESEHRHLVREQFPGWEQRVEFWHIDDLDCALAEQSLPQLAEQVRALVEELAAEATPVPHRPRLALEPS